MPIIDWKVPEDYLEEIRDLTIVIEDWGIKQWLEIAEVDSFKINGIMEPILTFRHEDTDRAVLGYLSWGFPKDGISDTYGWEPAGFVNFKQTRFKAPIGCDAFRLWLRRGIRAIVYLNFRDPGVLVPGSVSVNGKPIWGVAAPTP